MLSYWPIDKKTLTFDIILLFEENDGHVEYSLVAIQVDGDKNDFRTQSIL